MEEISHILRQASASLFVQNLEPGFHPTIIKSDNKLTISRREKKSCKGCDLNCLYNT